MIGAIIGDIIGSRFEFHNTNDRNFKLFTDECAITDDSICTIAIADAILKGEDYATSLMRWCKKYPHPMGGYGGSFAVWLRNGNIDTPYNSFGNGAAMRISAVGGAFFTDSEIIREAYKATHITHSHYEGIIGATCVARVIAHLKNDLYRALEYSELSRIACEYYGQYWDKPERLPKKGVRDESCQGCVPLALYIVERSTGFETAIRTAVAYGGDSDTLAAIVGSLAEERFGIEKSILKEASLFVPDEMKDIIREFYKKYYQGHRNTEIEPFFKPIKRKKDEKGRVNKVLPFV